MIINEAPQIPTGHKKGEERKTLEAERDYIMAHAHVGLKRYQLAQSELEGSTNNTHKALLLLADYLKASGGARPDEGAKEAAKESARQLVDTVTKQDCEGTDATCTMACLCSTIMIHEKEFSTAFQWLKFWITGLSKQAEKAEKVKSPGVFHALLQAHSLLVDIYLRINRVEHADSEVKAMISIDEDAPITLMAQASVLLRKQEKDIIEAGRIYEELQGRFGNTPLLLNGMAMSSMMVRDYPTAQSHIEEASAIRENDADTQINHMICKKQAKPTFDCKASLDILNNSAPCHPLVRRYKELEETFDDAAALVA
eukprot:TRINITY_DN12242_c0_g1_i1.p1 TRINITY_DN12242_c0_g1~~TRINITY_DN12242_c0_g1_i1.p1  ORF type:complete len:345 (+),score=68.41 TRINITY_DN12242_c0_g1_i1:99-1037(+)